MFRSIRKRRGADHKDEGRERGFSAPSVSTSKGGGSQAGPTAPATVVDEATVLLSRELSAMGRMEVGQAAKERGWAKLQRELERHPVQPAASPVAKKDETKTPVAVGAGVSTHTTRSHSRQWILGSTAAAVAVLAVLLGTYSAGLLTAGDGGHSGAVTSVASSDTSRVGTPTTRIADTTGSTGPTTATTQGPGTAVAPVTSPGTTAATQGPEATGTTTTTPVTAGPTTPTTQSVEGPGTTQPPRTTTTVEQQVVSAQLEKTAKAVVFDLGDLVIEYFVSGDMSGARALVASGAQSSLVQMISSLDNPNGFRWVGTKELSGDTVRVTLEFSDRVSNGQGELVAVAKRFFLTVQVDEGKAVITAISAGS
ncbi:MAG: hypothetical protein LLG45_11835 [Actinomycetia bacterium]|nr:hypothetical protein [Actinomycetes bacterium]